MADTPATEILGGRLPPGRHRLGRDVVGASQRARLVAAMAETVGARTYCESTVADVVSQAGVSRRTFYEHFSSKLDCFLAAYDTATELLIGAIAAAVSGRRGWRSRLRAGIDAYLGVLASSPALARTFVIEVAAAGDTALERRRAVHRRLVGLYRELNAVARTEEPTVRSVSDEQLLLVVGGTDQLVADHILHHGAAGLGGLAPTVVSVASALLTTSVSASALRATGTPEASLDRR